MHFLLECIGFPPHTDVARLIERVVGEGEGAPWRGDPRHHLRAPLGAGLELRADLDGRAEARGGPAQWSLTPYFRVPHRLRVAVVSVQRAEGAPFDALIRGWACPPVPGEPELPERGSAPGAYRLAAWITDARRLAPPAERGDARALPPLLPGRVVALGIAGFALEVEAVRAPAAGERPASARIRPLEGEDAPAGCCEASLTVRAVRHVENAWTRETVALLECDAPGRPWTVFVSPWQLARDGLAMPRVGWRVEGTFLMTGRLEGGVARPLERAGRHFG